MTRHPIHMDANGLLSELCNYFTSVHIKIHNEFNRCFPQKKLTSEERAHVENLIHDLEVILREDDELKQHQENVIVFERKR